MTMTKALASLTLLLLSTTRCCVRACTDILVTPGASADGSAMIAYNADSPTLFGVLYHYPNTTTSSSTPANKRKVYDWDSGVYLGEIDEAPETYNVVGNGNEHGLVIGESTFGGVAVLAGTQTDAKIDYGSLIYITLQRAKTCREAIATMASLMDEYGYYSAGESFSLADSTTGEVWIMEVISRGNEWKKKGAVWVAMKIPDGAVAAHANQARIRTFPREEPENCLFADDVVDVAVHYGLYPADADPKDFSFSDVYDPADFVTTRMGDARVWSIFSKIVDTTGTFQAEYQSYAMGHNLTHRMPLYVTPYEKLAVDDVMRLLASHYEHTPMDSSLDVGAGLFEAPYRPRPLVWTLEEEEDQDQDTTGNKDKETKPQQQQQQQQQQYHNERSVATAKTGWTFVAQVRPYMPAPLAVLIWFACDDSSTVPRTPVYASSRAIAKPYAGGGAQDGVFSPLLEFSLSKAFWVQNMVSNFAYYRWKDVYPILRKKIDSIQRDLMQKVSIVDQRALELYKDGSNTEDVDKAIQFVTLFSVNAGNKLHQTWMAFYGELFVRFRDFYTIVPKKDEPVCNCQAQEPGMSQATKNRIVQETGDHYKVLEAKEAKDIVNQPKKRPETVNGESWSDAMRLNLVDSGGTSVA